jgi:hypothetical protein
MDELDEPQRWDLLRMHVKPIVGRAEILQQHFVDNGLNPIPDWDPERHVNIVGWPSAEEERTSIAQALYAEQRFFPAPM